MRTPPHRLSHAVALLATTLVITSTVFASDLAVYSLAGALGNQVSSNPTTVANGTSASALTRGSGITATSGSNSMNSSGWPTTASIDPNDYYEFTISLNGATSLDIDQILVRLQRSTTGPTNFELRSSVDSYGSALAATPMAVPTSQSLFTLNLGTDFDALSGPVTFRIFGYSASAAGGTMRITNSSGGEPALVVKGTASGITATLSLTLNPTTIAENAGPGAVTGTVTRTGDLTNPLTVTLSSSDTSEATVPASVTIAANEASANFLIDIQNDTLPDGPQNVTITASAPVLGNASQVLVVNDDGDPVTVFLRINEVEADTAGLDTGEFVEIYNDTPNAADRGNKPLDGFVLAFINGANNQVYRAIDLDGGVTNAAGFFVAGNSAVPNVSSGHIWPDNTLQNAGADQVDAVALYIGEPSQIPNGTLASAITIPLIDAFIYGSPSASTPLPGILLEPGQIPVPIDTAPNSNSRRPDGGAARTTSLFVQQLPTPGSTNVINYYATWLAQYPGLNPDLEADDDGDGLKNVLEYAMGTNPQTHPSATDVLPEFRANGDGSFLYSVRRGSPAAQDPNLTLVIQFSTDLQNWGVVQQTPADPSDPFLLTNPDSYQAVYSGARSAMFFRARASRIP